MTMRSEGEASGELGAGSAEVVKAEPVQVEIPSQDLSAIAADPKLGVLANLITPERIAAGDIFYVGRDEKGELYGAILPHGGGAISRVVIDRPSFAYAKALSYLPALPVELTPALKSEVEDMIAQVKRMKADNEVTLDGNNPNSEQK